MGKHNKAKQKKAKISLAPTRRHMIYLCTDCGSKFRSNADEPICPICFSDEVEEIQQ